MQEYPKRPTGNIKKDIEEIYSYLFRSADRENKERKELKVGNTTLTEKELIKLKELIGGK